MHNILSYIHLVLACILSGGIARFTRVLFELPCYPQFELEIHIVEVSYFTNIIDQLIWSLVVNSILQITPTFITFFWIFVILKLHILFGYCVDDDS